MRCEHNLIRTQHNAAKLEFNSTLDDLAQKYAQKMASSAKFEHNLERGWNGENLYTYRSNSSSFFKFTDTKCRSI